MKKGFTLIELLAVLAVLSIIALISTPIIYNTVKKQNDKIFKENIDKIITILKTDAQSDDYIYPREYKIENKKIILTKKLDTEYNNVVSFEGKLDDLNGIIKFNVDGSIFVSLTSSKYCIHKGYNDKSIIYKDNKNNSCDYTTNNDCFKFNNDSNTIYGYDFNNESCPTDIVIPEMINNKPVENIGDYAFTNYSNIIYYYQDLYGNYSGYTTNINVGINNQIIKPLGIKSSNLILSCDKNDGTTVNKDDNNYVINSSNNEKYCYFNSYQDVSGSLTSVDFSNAKYLKKIGVGAFYNNNLKYLYFKNNLYLTSIEPFSFSNNDINIISFNNTPSLKYIKNNAFKENNNINYIYLEGANYLKSIEDNTFSNLSNLKNINLPSGIFNYGDIFNLMPISTKVKTSQHENSNYNTILKNKYSGSVQYSTNDVHSLSVENNVTINDTGSSNQSLYSGTSVHLIPKDESKIVESYTINGIQYYGNTFTMPDENILIKDIKLSNTIKYHNNDYLISNLYTFLGYDNYKSNFGMTLKSNFVYNNNLVTSNNSFPIYNFNVYDNNLLNSKHDFISLYNKNISLNTEQYELRYRGIQNIELELYIK